MTIRAFLELSPSSLRREVIQSSKNMFTHSSLLLLLTLLCDDCAKAFKLTLILRSKICNKLQPDPTVTERGRREGEARLSSVGSIGRAEGAGWPARTRGKEVCTPARCRVKRVDMVTG